MFNAIDQIHLCGYYVIKGNSDGDAGEKVIVSSSYRKTD